jgi:hypothetical protein
MTLQVGMKRTLLGVLCIMGLETNRISFNKMIDEGVHTPFQKDMCNMVKGVMVLMKGFQIGTLYMLLGNIHSTRCNNIIALEIDSNMTQLELMLTQLDSTRDKSVQINSTRHEEIDPTRIWHERMRHIGEKGLQAMQRKGMVKGFPECGLEVDFCEHCIYGKQS